MMSWHLDCDYLPGCCGIVVIYDFPEPPFYFDKPKLTQRDVRRAVNVLRAGAVLASLNENQKKDYEPELLKFGFKKLATFTGNEGLYITLYMYKRKNGGK